MSKYTVFYVAFDNESEHLDSDVVFVSSSSENLNVLLPIVENAIAAHTAEDDATLFNVTITGDSKVIHRYSVRMKCIDGIIEYLEVDGNEVIRWW